MPRRPWSEISARVRSDPERAARIAEGTHAILDAAALQKIRESRDLTQTALASSLDVSQARVSHLERQDDLYLSTLDQYVRAMGGELRVSVIFPDETIDLVGTKS